MKRLRNLAFTSLALLASGCATYRADVGVALPGPDLHAIGNGSSNIAADVVQYGGRGLGIATRVPAGIMESVPHLYHGVQEGLYDAGNFIEQHSFDLSEKIRE